MAIVRSVLGKFNGTMADVTFSNWKGQNVVKQKVPDTNGSQSPAQVSQRTKFRALSTISSVAGTAIRVGYKLAAVTMTEQNVFMSRNKDAVTLNLGGLPVYDWSKFDFSEGKFLSVDVQGGSMTTANQTMTVQWQDNSNGGSELASDIAVLVVVKKSNQQGFSVVTSARRDDATVTINNLLFGSGVVGDFAVYIFFKRASTTATSNTVYCNF